jgi:hypothetical protein
MRRGYDPSYGSKEQLKDCHQAGMELMRERDKLKVENAVLQDELIELKAIIAYITQGE